MIRLVRTLSLPDLEKEAILGTPTTRRFTMRGDTIYHPDEVGGPVRVLVEGIALQYKLLENGDRQSADLVFPTRFCYLGCLVFGRPDHFLEAVTDGEVLEVQTSGILDLFARYPRIPALLLHQEIRDRSILFEHLLSVGRRHAGQRLAHLLTEIRLRRELAGVSPVQARSVSLGLQLIADLLGLTRVHVSRTFNKLKEKGLLERQGNSLLILEPEALMNLAEFDFQYLHSASMRAKAPLLPPE